MTHQDESILVSRAVEGDSKALAKLLLLHYDALERYLKRRIPPELATVVAVEDVIQESHVQAFRSISSFRANGENGFYRWLRTIAKSRLLDHIKRQGRQKRGGDHKRVRSRRNTDSSDSLLVAVARHSTTPSRVMASRERQQALQVGLASLKEDYREALRLRYLEGWPVADIARRMQRSEHAVHMLCNRGIRKLKEALGRRSGL